MSHLPPVYSFMHVLSVSCCPCSLVQFHSLIFFSLLSPSSFFQFGALHSLSPFLHSQTFGKKQISFYLSSFPLLKIQLLSSWSPETALLSPVTFRAIHWMGTCHGHLVATSLLVAVALLVPVFVSWSLPVTPSWPCRECRCHSGTPEPPALMTPGISAAPRLQHLPSPLTLSCLPLTHIFLVLTRCL